MQNNNRKMFETLVSRTKIYLAIILVLVIIVGIENSKLIIPAIVLFLIVMGYTYYANKKRKSESYIWHCDAFMCCGSCVGK